MFIHIYIYINCKWYPAPIQTMMTCPPAGYVPMIGGPPARRNFPCATSMPCCQDSSPFDWECVGVGEGIYTICVCIYIYTYNIYTLYTLYVSVCQLVDTQPFDIV